MDITGQMASDNRERLTGRNTDGCGINDETTCPTVTDCEWNAGLAYCLGKNYNYYSGVCLRVTTGTNLII
jgi:hypothetical protein